MFYIDSIGHSASGWLAYSLNKNSKIVCFHGSRSFPPIDTFNYNHKLYNEFSLINFCGAMYECSKNTKFEKIFGSVHGFRNSISNELFESLPKNFKFFSIIRDPIQRVDSVFQETCKKNKMKNFYELDKSIFDKTQKLYHQKRQLIKTNKFIKNIVFNSEILINFLKKFRRENSSADSIYFNYFVMAVELTLNNDFLYFLHLKKIQILKFEEFTRSKQYFMTNIYEKILDNHDRSNNYVDEIFNNEDHVHTHRIKNKDFSSKEIFFSWPKSLQDYFNYYLDKLDSSNLGNHQFKKFYSNFDYKFFG